MESLQRSNTWWVNNGHYTSGTLDVLQNNQNFYNYCQLFINDKMSIVGGGAGFNIKNGSYWRAKDKDGRNF